MLRCYDKAIFVRLLLGVASENVQAAANCGQECPCNQSCVESIPGTSHSDHYVGRLLVLPNEVCTNLTPSNAVYLRWNATSFKPNGVSPNLMM